ncbi:MAG: DUF2723 domain-containing protein [bacterium]
MKNYKRLLYPFVAFLFSFIIYIITTAPDLTFTDSGELAAVCTTLGIAHPTGYPLFILLGHLWTYLPFFSTNIYSLNIFAGFLTAISVVVFFNTVLFLLKYINNIPDRKKQNRIMAQKHKKTKELKDTKSIEAKKETKILNESVLQNISIIVAFLYAFARTIWAQAVAIEVYSLHLLMMNLVLFFFFKGILSDENRKGYLLFATLLLGLSFANHMTTVLLVPMIIVLYFWQSNILRQVQDGSRQQTSDSRQDFGSNIKLLFILIIPFLLGLSLYLYLPIRASGFPEFNWGWVSRGFDKFWYHFSGKQYQVWMFSDSTVWKDNLIKFFEMIPNEIAWIGILPLFYGLYTAFRKSKFLFYGILILILTCISYAINYQIHDIDSYFVTAFVGILIFISIGLLYLAKQFPQFVYSFFVLPLFALTLNYSYNDRSDDVIVPEYTKMVFGKLEPNAIILSTQWDYWLSASWYKQRVDGFRKDVIIIDKELLRRTWYIEQLKRWYPKQINVCQKEINDYMIDLELFESGEYYNPASIQSKFINLLNCFVDNNYEKHPIYITLDVLETVPDAFQGYEKVASGFAFKLSRDKEPKKVKASDINIDKFVESIKTNEGHLVDGIKTMAAISLVNLGRYSLMQGEKVEAKIAFEKAYQIDPANRFVNESIRNFNNIRFED